MKILRRGTGALFFFVFTFVLLPFDVQAQSSNSFTIALLPDTQMYTFNEDWTYQFDDQVDWIIENNVYDIRYVIHLGDITEKNSEREWQAADRIMSQLYGEVPFAIVAGNHDYGSSGSSSSNFTWFDDFFPLSELQNQSSAINGFNGNGRSTYHKFTVGGKDYMILALDWAPDDSVVAWANQVVASHPNHTVIVATHLYLHSDNNRYQRGRGQSNHLDEFTYGAGRFDGENLWQEFIRKHPNILMVVSGHAPGDGLGFKTSVGDNGNVVYEMAVNYQRDAQGGNGYLRLLEINGDTVRVESYSPSLDSYKLDAQNDFTMVPVIPETIVVENVNENQENTEVNVVAESGASTPPEVTNTENLVAFDPDINTTTLLMPGESGVLGDRVQWITTIRNKDVEVMTDIVLNSNFPSGVSIESVQSTIGTASIVGRDVVLDIPVLRQNENATIYITTDVTVAGTNLDNEVCVSKDSQSHCVLHSIAGATVVQLPATGESVWWRTPLISFAGVFVLMLLVVPLALYNRHRTQS